MWRRRQHAAKEFAMKGASFLTIMLMLSLAIFAYAEAAQPTSSSGERARASSGWFGRPVSCGWNRHWSHQYGKCIKTMPYKPLD